MLLYRKLAVFVEGNGVLARMPLVLHELFKQK
jgi:hypothetical protein